METGILPPELRSIEQLFTGDTRFVVPPYQRSFAWGPDEFEELWDDLLAAVRRKGDYFLGTVVLQKVAPRTFDIIDGQQRLSCITMMFSAIRNVFLAAHDNDRATKILEGFLGTRDYTRESPIRPKLELNRINNELFVRHVIESGNLDAIDGLLRTKKLVESNKLLLQAYKFFLGKVTLEAANRGTQSDDFIVPLIDCLRDSVKLIAITVNSAEDANLFFESLNARGKELAISDLVKNRLYTEAGDQVTRAQQLWEHMENEPARTPVPEYLRHYWIAKKTDPKNLKVREKQLYRAIADDVKGKRTATIELLADLDASAHDYVKIGDPSLWSEDNAYDNAFEASLDDLKLFRVSQCNPLLLNAVQRFKSAKDIARTFRIVANFSFRYFIIGNQSPGNLELEVAKIAYEIRSGTITDPQGIADAFRALSPDASFRSDFSLATMPKSKAKIARYTLARITNHLRRQTKKSGVEEIVNPDAKQVNLEHILPQSFGPAWRSEFSTGIDPAEFVFRIGNLTLLTRKMNDDAGNASFSEKQRLALSTSALAINERFRGVKGWGDKEIEQRQTEMAKIAVEVWTL